MTSRAAQYCLAGRRLESPAVHGVRHWLLIVHSHTHCRMEGRPTNWPVYRLDQGPKLCNCSPTRGLRQHDGFQIIGDISTLRVLSQVKHMLNQSYIYSRLKIPLYIPGSIKTHRIYTRDFIYHARITMKLNDMIQVYSSGSTVIMHMHCIWPVLHNIMFGCYKRKQRYVFWYEKWQKNIFQ